MIVLSLSDISVSYGGRTIITHASIDVRAGEKVALVGANGAGKSTLLKVAMGIADFDAGSRQLKRDAVIGYLAQTRRDEGHEFAAEETVWSAARSVFAHVDALEEKLHSLTERMAHTQGHDAPTATVTHEYESTQRAFEEAGGYAIDSTVRRVLSGMQFPADDWQRSVSALSGGQKTRLRLACLLLQTPDILMLDEPTNYLDLETVAWLEEYLQQYRGALLIVSHDRYFLDRATQVTIELEDGRTTRYPGNYSTYATLKEQRLQEQAESFEKQQDTIAKLEDFIARNLVRASTTKRAQSRRKVLEKMERIDRPTTRPEAVLSLHAGVPGGKMPLVLDQVSVSMQGQRLFAPISVKILRGDHVALLGRNGVGKTTLLRAIMGEHPYEGQLTFAKDVKTAYFAQEQDQYITEATVLHELWDAYPGKSETEIRTRLGQLLFRGEDVNKPVSALSGGERSRLALAKLSFGDANTLLLDEPTNHLDLPAREVLEEALIGFEGTLLFVSHDRYFINRVATRILYLTPTGLIDVEGDYDEFLRVEKDRAEQETKAQSGVAKTDNEVDWQRRKEQKSADRKLQERIARVEAKIAELELQSTSLEAKLSDPALYDDPQLALWGQTHAEIAAQLETLYEEWARLSDGD